VPGLCRQGADVAGGIPALIAFKNQNQLSWIIDFRQISAAQSPVESIAANGIFFALPGAEENLFIVDIGHNFIGPTIGVRQLTLVVLGEHEHPEIKLFHVCQTGRLLSLAARLMEYREQYRGEYCHERYHYHRQARKDGPRQGPSLTLQSSLAFADLRQGDDAQYQPR